MQNNIRQQGWTLVELLIVLVCVSTLTAILILGIASRVHQQSSILQTTSDVKTLMSAVHTWRQNQDSYQDGYENIYDSSNWTPAVNCTNKKNVISCLADSGYIDSNQKSYFTYRYSIKPVTSSTDPASACYAKKADGSTAPQPCFQVMVTEHKPNACDYIIRMHATHLAVESAPTYASCINGKTKRNPKQLTFTFT